MRRALSIECTGARIYVSGGVDSAVAATLTKKALGPERVSAVHIDNGLLRKGESAAVRDAMKGIGLDVQVVDHSARYLDALSGVRNPEQKRRIIGDLFADAFEKELAAELGPGTFLVQGTLYTDRIESGSGVGRRADVIKTHHNVGSEKIRRLHEQGRVVEPNDGIYKDEVRRVGELLGLPEEIVWRHPFPGPGLAVRVICDSYMPDNFDGLVSGVRTISGDHGLKGYAMPVRTVGVQGDERTYTNLAVLAGDFDWEKIRQAASDITHNTRINRVFYALTQNEFNQESLGELAPLNIDRRTLGILREADDIAQKALRKYGLLRTVSQMPVVIFPGYDRPWIAIRDVVTDDYMTSRPAEKPGEFPMHAVHDIVRKIMSSPEIKRHGGVDVVGFDVTDKPPATIEWE